MKTTITSAITASIVLPLLWTASFFTHSNFDSLEVVPEWNGPDYKVTYKCDSSYEKMEGLHMVDNGDTVTVNYGALGRRRGFRNFKCNQPVNTEGAASR